jgi:tetratricopeptide (TPR) repeat protein
LTEAEALGHELVGRGLRDEGLAWLEEAEAGEGPVRTAALAALPFVRTPPAELTRLRDRLRDWDPGPIRMDRPGPADWSSQAWVLPHLRLYLMALLETRLGRDGEALRLAGELKQLDGIPEARTLASDMALHVRAQVAMDQGLMAEALRLVREASFWEASPWDERFSAVFFHAAEVNLRADALQAMGRYREAIRWHSMVTFGANRGYNHYRRAQAYEALGEPDRAAAHYAEFLRLWKDADPDLADLLADARRRLEAMAAEK